MPAIHIPEPREVGVAAGQDILEASRESQANTLIELHQFQFRTNCWIKPMPP